MKNVFSLTVSAVLLGGLIALYMAANGSDADYKPMWAAEFFFCLGLLLLGSYFFWEKVFLLKILKWIFSDLSFPRGVRWLPWWGAVLMVASLVSAVHWIVAE